MKVIAATAQTVSSLACCVAIIIPFAAEAEDSPIAEASVDHAFEAGVRAFEAGELELALTTFTSALDMVEGGTVQSEEIRLNIALCLEHLGRHRQAASLYDELAQSDMLDEERREIAGRSAVQSRRRLGTLTVEGSPEGAQVIVDDEELCELPCEVQLDPGHHEVIIRADVGEASGSVEIEAGAVERIRLMVRAARSEPSQPSPESTPTPRRRPTALTWAGFAHLVLGGAGIIGFGVSALTIHDDYVQSPSIDLRERGVLMRNFANISIGFAVIGAALVIVDIIVGFRRRRSNAGAATSPPTTSFLTGGVTASHGG